MNKNIKKISSMLEAKEKEHNFIVEKAAKDLKATNEELSSIQAAIDSADNPEEYRKLLQDKRDFEATKEFCEKKLAEANNHTISKEDNKEILSAIKQGFEEIQAEHKKTIEKTIDLLISQLREYDSDSEIYKEFASRLSALTKEKALLIQPATLYSITDTNNPYRFIVNGYYELRKNEDLRDQIHRGVRVIGGRKNG